jgi:hypothetical protein
MDTRSKRASSVGIGLIWLLSPIAPDASFSQGDRQHGGLSYSGILAAEPVQLTTSRIELTAVYDPVIELAARYDPTLELSAVYDPVIELPAYFEDGD